MLKDMFEVFVMMVIVMVFFCTAILFGVNYWNQYTCGKYEQVTDRLTKWVFMDDCYINSNNEWLTKSEYSKIIIARQGLQSR